MDNDKKLLMPEDELSIKIRQCCEKQAKQRARAQKFETLFIKWFDKIFPFFKFK